MPGDVHDTTVAETFAEVARLLLAEHGVEATLTKVGQLAVQTIQGCDHAGVSLIEGRRISTVGASDDVPVQVDEIQYEVDEGPCLDAIRQHQVFLVGRLSDEERWPSFSRRAAAETGVASMLSLRLFVEQDTMGALNLYSRDVDAFDPDAQAMAAVFAAHASVALSAELQQEQFHEALSSRDVIGQAKGLLMAREGVTPDEAFQMLRRASQRLNIKLREVAERVAAAPAEQPPESIEPGDRAGEGAGTDTPG
ncbi:MAG TPA: GAF and ANTAR domain-containing protein [Acidimicrobiales bacterium]|nr:GAF and ANTAR domain-containing protein [Acidimicrobiales bacterium]